MRHTSLTFGCENQIADEISTICTYKDLFGYLTRSYIYSNILSGPLLTIGFSDIVTSSDAKVGVTIYNADVTFTIIAASTALDKVFYGLNASPDPTKTLYWEYDGTGDIAVGGVPINKRIRVVN